MYKSHLRNQTLVTTSDCSQAGRWLSIDKCCEFVALRRCNWTLFCKVRPSASVTRSPYKMSLTESELACARTRACVCVYERTVSRYSVCRQSDAGDDRLALRPSVYIAVFGSSRLHGVHAEVTSSTLSNDRLCSSLPSSATERLQKLNHYVE